MRTNRHNLSFIVLALLAPVTGLVSLALFTKALPLTLSKAIYYCQQFISNTFFQIPHTLPQIIIGLLEIALLLGIISFLLQLYKTHALLKSLYRRKVAFSPGLEKVAIRLSLANSICLIEDNRLFSFCHGLFSPKIIITSKLISSLHAKELEAVLLHEKSHLLNRDPFKMLIGKAVSSMFFFLPIFSQLNRNINATNEFLADHFVAEYQGTSIFLKQALRRILSTSQFSFSTVPAIASSDHLEIRIYKLLNPSFKHNLKVSPISILTSLLFLGVSFILLQSPVNAFQTKDSSETSYYVCSSDDACSRQCNLNNQSKKIESPQQLFSPYSKLTY